MYCFSFNPNCSALREAGVPTSLSVASRMAPEARRKESSENCPPFLLQNPPTNGNLSQTLVFLRLQSYTIGTRSERLVKPVRDCNFRAPLRSRFSSGVGEA